VEASSVMSFLKCPWNHIYFDQKYKQSRGSVRHFTCDATRGIIDRILMGVGTARGRRSSFTLRINDVIDFWRVEDLITDKRLLLRAEMKLSGRAWMEFTIDQEESKNRLSLKAYYQPQGLFGIIYWYLAMPFHHFVFNDLIEQIEKRT